MAKNPNTIEVYRGQSKDVSLKILRDSRDVDDNPIEIPLDLTGCEVIFSVRTNAQNQRTILTKTSSDVTQISIAADPKTGMATIFIDYEETQEIIPATYYFDVWVVETSGRRYPVVEPSEFIVLPAITHFES